jgi:hypothetical protein
MFHYFATGKSGGGPPQSKMLARFTKAHASTKRLKCRTERFWTFADHPLHRCAKKIAF